MRIQKDRDYWKELEDDQKEEDDEEDVRMKIRNYNQSQRSMMRIALVNHSHK